MTKKIQIGTRGSKLALWQTNWVKSEIEQNNRLLSLIGAKKTTYGPILNLTDEEIGDARKWIEKHKIPEGTKLIGFHPGSGKGQAWKRWDIDNFVAVSKKMELLSDVKVIFFFRTR